ncbi:MAG TPA: PspC domain-containing protein [Allosphingosinicella sp.]|nr:PspC domain-containing protein [Allosphingosinicella sp.]
MPFSDTNVFARDDTFFGVCQAIGEDLGFNSNYLRIAFALPLLYAPLATIAAYLALAVVVLLTRLIVPNPRRAAVADTMADDEAASADANEMEPMPIAA